MNEYSFVGALTEALSHISIEWFLIALSFLTLIKFSIVREMPENEKNEKLLAEFYRLQGIAEEIRVLDIEIQQRCEKLYEIKTSCFYQRFGNVDPTRTAIYVSQLRECLRLANRFESLANKYNDGMKRGGRVLQKLNLPNNVRSTLPLCIDPYVEIPRYSPS